jgi:hypothetical protein
LREGLTRGHIQSLFGILRGVFACVWDQAANVELELGTLLRGD